VSGGPRAFVPSAELARAVEDAPEVRERASALLASGALVPTFAPPMERCVGPGLCRGVRERGAISCSAAIAIDLPRLARRAGPWREDALLEELARAVEASLDALAAVQRFQREVAPPLALRSRASGAVVPVGLREALRWLGDGEVRPEQGARLLAFLSEAVERFGRARSLHAAVTPFFGDRAAARFAELDAERFQVSQPLLFEGVERERERGLAYSRGFDLGPEPAGRTTAGAAVLAASQKSGAFHPATTLAAARGEDAFARWERLERQRERLRGGAPSLYALPSLASREEPDPEGFPDLAPLFHAATDATSP